MMVELLYFDGCPHWQMMAAQLKELAGELGFSWTPIPVETPEEAVVLRFHGSPSLHINGEDPFAEPEAPVGLTCRVYQTAAGWSGSPGLQVLRTTLVRAQRSTL
jgi:hypothetical protein